MDRGTAARSDARTDGRTDWRRKEGQAGRAGGRMMDIASVTAFTLALSPLFESMAILNYFLPLHSAKTIHF